MKKLIVIFAMVLMSQMVKGQYKEVFVIDSKKEGAITVDSLYIENVCCPGSFTEYILTTHKSNISTDYIIVFDDTLFDAYSNITINRLSFYSSLIVGKDGELTPTAKDNGIFIDKKTGILVKSYLKEKNISCQLIK